MDRMRLMDTADCISAVGGVQGASPLGKEWASKAQ